MVTGYRTQQREALLNYFCRHRGQAMSAQDLAQGILDDPTVTPKPGRSTVYRLVQKLADEGLIKRYMQENSRQFVYEMTDRDEHCSEHLHLKCITCEKLIHLDKEETSRVRQDVERDGFQLDSRHTVLFGLCAHCRKEQEQP